MINNSTPFVDVEQWELALSVTTSVIPLESKTCSPDSNALIKVTYRQ